MTILLAVLLSQMEYILAMQTGLIVTKTVPDVTNLYPHEDRYKSLLILVTMQPKEKMKLCRP